MCLARTGAPDPSEDPLFPPKENIERLRSTVDDAQPRSLSASEQRLIASEHNGDAVDRSQVATTKLLSERTPEGGNQRPGFRNPPQFNSLAALESSPGFERPYEGVLRPPQEKTMPPEERVAAWICSETSDEVPDLEEAEKEMYVYMEGEEEVETSGFGKSSSQEASTLSSENSGNYHSFGEAQVPIKELLKSKMPF